MVPRLSSVTFTFKFRSGATLRKATSSAVPSVVSSALEDPSMSFQIRIQPFWVGKIAAFTQGTSVHQALELTMRSRDRLSRRRLLDAHVSTFLSMRCQHHVWCSERMTACRRPAFLGLPGDTRRMLQGARRWLCGNSECLTRFFAVQQ